MTSPALLPSAISLNIEQQIIGALLTDFNAEWKYCESLTPEVFSDALCRHVFQIIKRQAADGTIPDMVTIAETMSKHNKIDVVDICSGVISTANTGTYVRALVENYNKRCLRNLSVGIQSQLKDPLLGSDDIVRKIEETVMQLRRFAPASTTGLRGILMSRVNEIYGRTSSEDYLTGVPSGYEALDRITLGFQRNNMIVLAARPMMGKTALAINITDNAASRNLRVGMFEIEMSKSALITRMLSARARVVFQRLKGKQPLMPDEKEKIETAAARIYELPVHIFDTQDFGAPTLPNIVAAIQRYHAEYKFDLVIVDHLHRFADHNPRQSPYAKMSEISSTIADLGKRLGTANILLAQLSREPEKRGAKRPKLSDLRDSGTLEQDADDVILLYRPEVYKDQMKSKVISIQGRNVPIEGVALLDIAKHRDGELGTVALTWRGQFQRFDNYTIENPDYEEENPF